MRTFLVIFDMIYRLRLLFFLVRLEFSVSMIEHQISQRYMAHYARNVSAYRACRSFSQPNVCLHIKISAYEIPSANSRLRPQTQVVATVQPQLNDRLSSSFYQKDRHTVRVLMARVKNHRSPTTIFVSLGSRGPFCPSFVWQRKVKGWVGRSPQSNLPSCSLTYIQSTIPTQDFGHL